MEFADADPTFRAMQVSGMCAKDLEQLESGGSQWRWQR
jgi:hypothetical protein